MPARLKTITIGTNCQCQLFTQRPQLIKLFRALLLIVVCPVYFQPINYEQQRGINGYSEPRPSIGLTMHLRLFIGLYLV